MSNTINETFPVFANGYRLIKKDDKDFVLVFYHDSSRYEYFSNPDEVLFSQTKYKQSVLEYIDEDFKIESNNYEFILQYPDYEGYEIHWTQSLNPIDNTTINNVLSENISCTHNNSEFLGLSLSYEYTETYIDGTPGSLPNISYWYSIGAYRNYTVNGDIPGPRINGTGYPVKKVLLYIRIIDVQLVGKFPPWKIPHITINCYQSYTLRLQYMAMIFLATS